MEHGFDGDPPVFHKLLYRRMTDAEHLEDRLNLPCTVLTLLVAPRYCAMPNLDLADHMNSRIRVQGRLPHPSITIAIVMGGVQGRPSLIVILCEAIILLAASCVVDDPYLRCLFSIVGFHRDGDFINRIVLLCVPARMLEGDTIERDEEAVFSRGFVPENGRGRNG